MQALSGRSTARAAPSAASLARPTSTAAATSSSRKRPSPLRVAAGANDPSISTGPSSSSPAEKRLAQALRAQSFRLESALEVLLARQQQQRGGAATSGVAAAAAPAAPATEEQQQQQPPSASLVGVDGDIWQVVEELSRVAKALEEAGLRRSNADDDSDADTTAAVAAAATAAAKATRHAASWAVARSPAPVQDSLQAAYPPARPLRRKQPQQQMPTTTTPTTRRLPLPPQHPRPPSTGAAAPTRRISVCAGSKCRRAGGDALLAAASGAAAAAASAASSSPAGAAGRDPLLGSRGSSAPASSVEVGSCKCLGKCKRAPAVRVEEPDGTTVVLTNVGTDEVQRLVFASAPLFF